MSKIIVENKAPQVLVFNHKSLLPWRVLPGQNAIEEDFLQRYMANPIAKILFKKHCVILKGDVDLDQEEIINAEEKNKLLNKSYKGILDQNKRIVNASKKQEDTLKKMQEEIENLKQKLENK